MSERSLYLEAAEFSSVWPTVCKTVRPMLSVCLSVCLSVSDTGVLRQNGWMDRDETWHKGRPRPRSQFLRWGPTSRNGTQFSNFRPLSVCGQMAGWIKMPLGSEVGLGPGDTVLGWYPTTPSQKGAQQTLAYTFPPKSIVAKRLDGLRCHLVRR